MEGLSLVALLAAVLAIYLLRRAWLARSRAPADEDVGEEPSSPHPYHAVELQAGEAGCDLVEALRGQRFLSVEAPAIPLRGCDCAVCGCHYVHHPDRRSAQRRSLHAQPAHAGAAGRLRNPGRRVTDRLLYQPGMS